MKAFLCLTATAACIGLSAQAADFSYSGNFADDDDVVLFDFMVGLDSVVTLRSYSYAGGTQANGNVVAAGGFDPILSLFDSSGMLIGRQDDADDEIVPVDPDTGSAYDVLFAESLSAGSYTVAITQYDNFPNGNFLSDGFDFGSNSPRETAVFECSNLMFCDVNGNNRTSAYAFDLLDVDSASVTPPVQPTTPVPVPAALPLMVGALGGLALLRRRRG